MKKYLIIVILLVFASVVSLSQGKVNMKKQFTELDYEKKESTFSNPVVFQNNIYSLSKIRGGNDEFILTKHDLSFNVEKSIVLNNKNSFDFTSEILVLNNKIYLAGGKSDDKNSSDIFVKEFDPNSLEISFKEIFLVKNVSEKKKVSSSKFYIGESSLLVVRRLYDNKNYGTAEYELILFNGNIEKQWSKQYEFNALKEKVEYNNFKISKTGDVYFTSQTKSRKPNEKNIFIKGIINNGKNEIGKELIFDDNEVLKSYLLEFNNNQLIVAGFIEVKDQKESMTKYFVNRLNQLNLNKESEITNEIPLSVYLSNRDEKSAQKIKSKFESGKKSVIDYNIAITDILIRENGDIVLIAESHKSTGYGADYNYYGGNIYAVNIASKNELIWAKKIPKNTQFKYNGYESTAQFLLIEKDKELMFIFNNSADNHPLSDDKIKVFKPSDKSNKVLSMYRINEKGILTSEVLTDDKILINSNMNTKISVQIQDNIAIIFFGTALIQDNLALVVEF